MRTAPSLVLLAFCLVLAGCGFHLRHSADLPAAMQDVHVSVAGSAELGVQLERALLQAGADVHEQSGPGVAELKVRAHFASRALTVSSYARVREYTVRLQTRFQAVDSAGEPLLAPQQLEMQREFTYDRSQALGTATRRQQVRASLVEDMVRAILRRLQAAAGEDVASTSRSVR